MQRRFRIVLLLTVEVAALEALRRIGAGLPLPGRAPYPWVAQAPAEDVIAVAAWLAAVVVAAWLFLTTAAYLVTRIAGLPRAAHVLRRLTAPMIRRLVDGALVLTLAASVAAPAVPAGATELPPPLVLHVADDAPAETVPDLAPFGGPALRVVPPGVGSAGFAPAPSTVVVPVTEPPSPAATEPRSPDPEPVPDPGTTAARHTVVPGDNLWTIAAAHLRAHGSLDGVAPYWRQVIAANRATLRSGDPNLIFPGEIVTLPPIGAAR
jgi:hypothetical protein